MIKKTVIYYQSDINQLEIKVIAIINSLYDDYFD